MVALITFAILTLAVPKSPYLKEGSAEDAVRAVPTLDADGYKVGSKWLKADSGENIFIYTENGQLRFKVRARVCPEFKYYSLVRNQKGEVRGNVYRRESSVEVLKSKTGPKEKANGKYVSTLEKLPDGKARMTFDAECPEADRIANSSVFMLSRDFLETCAVTAEAELKTGDLSWKKPRYITFSDAIGRKVFALEFDTNEVQSVSINSDNGHLNVAHRHVRFSVTLDPGETFVPKTPPILAGGVDFMTESGVRVAEYSASANILLNPSFESGLRYWRTGVADDARTIVTNGVARSGRRCAKLDCTIQSVGLVLKSDTDYTFSAWIRPADRQGAATINVHPRGVRGKASFLKRLVLTQKKPNGDWERVAGSFRTPADFHECVLWIDGNGVLVDDIQLEEGIAASAYAGNPFGLELMTDQASETYADAKKPQNLRLRISGPVGSKGRVSVLGTDFFERELLRRSFDFALPDAGFQDLTLGPDRLWPLGPFVFTAKVEAAGSGLHPLSFTDYLRFTKIDARDGTDRLRGLQGTHLFGRLKPDITRPVYNFERLRDFGIGTLVYSGNLHGTSYERLTQADVDNLARYGLKDRWGGVLWGVNWEKTLNGKPWKWNGQSVNTLTNYPPEMLKWVEDECCEMAKAIPWTDFYAFHTEPHGSFETLRRNDFSSYARLMLAINHGLTRANPKNVFIPFGACNMTPHGGADQVVNFLKAAQEIEPTTRFRQIEIHTYRPLPEHPDVESDLQYFMNELAKIGYGDVPIKTGEGSYYYPMWRPSSDLYAWSHAGVKDRYSNVPIPTYDLGWGERIGAALVTRETIVYFRHQDRVNANSSWCPQVIDGRVPIAWTAAHAALMSLLGDATFLRDIRFAKDGRAYVFDDRKGQTVAFVWRGNVRYDHGLAMSVEMTMEQVPDLAILDLMGNEVKVEGQERTKLPLSGFPVYLKVSNAQRDALIGAIARLSP